MNFIRFLVNTPKASIAAVVVACAQLIKLFGIASCDEKTVNQIADAISIIAGFVGLYFAGKGKWPE